MYHYNIFSWLVLTDFKTPFHENKIQSPSLKRLQKTFLGKYFPVIQSKTSSQAPSYASPKL